MLRNGDIYKFSSRFAASVNQVVVARGDDDRRELAYVFRMSRICFVGMLEDFFAGALQGAAIVFYVVVSNTQTADRKEIFSRLYGVKIAVGKIALAKTEIVNCIENVCLANAVIAHKTVNPIEVLVKLGDILKVCYFQMLQVHSLLSVPSATWGWRLLPYADCVVFCHFFQRYVFFAAYQIGLRFVLFAELIEIYAV